MLAEYALDPELLSNWRDFRFYISQFGASQGRMISRYPKHWKRLVIEATQAASNVAQKNAEVAVEAVIKQVLDQAVEDTDSEIAEDFLDAFLSVAKTASKDAASDVTIGQSSDQGAFYIEH